MTPYAVRTGHIDQRRLALFDRLRADMVRMPDLDPPELVSCHAVCRALAMRHDGALCVDGWFLATGHDHSWLDLGDGIVADMYPIAGAVPFLVDTNGWMIPWSRIYVEKADLLDEGRRDRATHDRVAAELAAALDGIDAAVTG